MTGSRYWAVVPAAGIGRRMLESVPEAAPKQYLVIAGKTILAHTLSRLDALPALAGIVLVLNEQDPQYPAQGLALKTPLRTVAGGSQRAQSVYNGLAALEGQAADDDWVLVHDAVRPCVVPDDIERLMRTLETEPAGGLLAVPVSATLKKAGPGDTVDCTANRDEYWQAATPQMFRFGLLRRALAEALADGVLITDEAHAMERAGHRVKLVRGRADNIKITRAEDLLLAEHILQTQGVL